MNARIILGLVSVVLLSSSLVAGDRYYNSDRHDRDRTHKHVKKDYDRGNHKGSYTKNNHRDRGVIKNRYTKQELKRELRRLNKQDVKEQRRYSKRQYKRELRAERKRLERKELRRQAKKQQRREARREARRQEQLRVSYYDTLHNQQRRQRVHFKDIFRLPPPPMFYSRY